MFMKENIILSFMLASLSLSFCFGWNHLNEIFQNVFSMKRNASYEFEIRHFIFVLYNNLAFIRRYFCNVIWIINTPSYNYSLYICAYQILDVNLTNVAIFKVGVGSITARLTTFFIENVIRLLGHWTKAIFQNNSIIYIYIYIYIERKLKTDMVFMAEYKKS